MTTPCLSVRQPWASAILADPPHRKHIENRTWATRMRGRIGIHASQVIDRAALALVQNANVKDLGVILGTVQVVGCHKQNSAECLAEGCQFTPWAQFSDNPHRPIWHWVLEQPAVYVTPIKSRGALQLWHPTDPVAYLMEIGEYQ